MAELTGTPIETKTRVWIELPKMAGASVERQTDIAVKGTVMLHKLGFNEHVAFWWNGRKNVLCLTLNEAEEFMELPDNGHWFNLNFIATGE